MTDKTRQKTKSQKTGATDAVTIDFLIRELRKAGQHITPESTIDQVDGVMEMVLELFKLRSSLQASKPRSQSQRKTRNSKLKQADLALLSGFHAILWHYLKDTPLGTPVTAFPEFSGKQVKYIPLSLIAKIYPYIQNLQCNVPKGQKDLVLEIHYFIDMALLDLTHIMSWTEDAS